MTPSATVEVGVDRAASGAVLLVVAGTKRCAFPADRVDLVTRPLPVEAVPGSPPWLRGVAVVRGFAVPIADLVQMLGGVVAPRARWVILRAAPGRLVGLEVDGVTGVVPQDALAHQPPVPLLGSAAEGVVEALAALDAELAFVLDAARLVDRAEAAAGGATA